MKRSDPQSVEQIIREAILASNLSADFDAHRASSMWPEIVGPDISRQTVRRYVDGTVLHVYIYSAPLKDELSFHRERLVALLNEAVGREALTDIRFH